MEKETILYFTLKKMSDGRGKASQSHSETKLTAKWQRFGYTLGKYRQRAALAEGSQLALMEYRLQCKGTLENARLLRYELPISAEMLQADSRLQKRAAERIERIVYSYDRDCAVLYEDKLEECLGIQPRIPFFLTEGIVQEMFWRYDGIEEVVLIEGEDNPLDLLYGIYEALNRLTIVTEDAGRYDAFVNEVYEETGLVAVCMEAVPERTFIKGMPLIIDMTRSGKVAYRQIPSGALYVDLCSDSAKRRTIRLKCNDVHYVNCLKFLDSCKENTV